jgi:purine-binding chemotaxis protein CheW
VTLEEIYVREAVEHGLACFFLEGEMFGVNIRLVREINPHLDITPVYTAPSHVSGLVNLRGQIVTVIDLGERLGLGKRTINESSRLVILKTNEELAGLADCTLETSDDKIGLLIDRIADVITPSQDDLEPPPPNLGGVGSEFLSGVCKIESRSIGMLDTRSLLTMATEAES